jgi:hypothetical protein
MPAGKLDGIPLWKLEVTIEPGFSLYKQWSIGVRTGPVTRRLELSTWSSAGCGFVPAPRAEDPTV